MRILMGSLVSQATAEMTELYRVTAMRSWQQMISPRWEDSMRKACAENLRLATNSCADSAGH